ncbi:MAG TPA: helix-turn-helix transcriptional regulator [Mollicutes bacterium]|nr:helix-turn-helix transcriptional regulator [Mollicutes bacterium]
MKFNVRKNKASFGRWHKYYIGDAKTIIKSYEESSRFYGGREDLYHEAKNILNQYESLKLSLTKIEIRVLEEYLVGLDKITDMDNTYLNKTVEMIYRKWILICFPDENIYRKKITPKKLGKILRQLRLNKGYSVVSVADQLKINESTLRNYELGNRLPRIDILYALAEIYKSSIDEIIKKVIK